MQLCGIKPPWTGIGKQLRAAPSWNPSSHGCLPFAALLGIRKVLGLSYSSVQVLALFNSLEKYWSLFPAAAQWQTIWDAEPAPSCGQRAGHLGESRGGREAGGVGFLGLLGVEWATVLGLG